MKNGILCNRIIGIVLAITIGISFKAGMVAAIDTPYAARIDYKQMVVLILDKEDLNGWPEGDPAMDNDFRGFNEVMVSADGSKVLYKAQADFTAVGTERRPFVVNTDGTGLQDASAIFPSDIVSRSWGWDNMRINDTGSRFFIKALRYEAGVINETQVYYFDIPGGTVGRAEADGFGTFDWFNINTDGSRLYHGKYDNGLAQGLWYTDFGGPKNLIFDIATLPCDTGTGLCDSLNALAFLGSSTQNDQNYFSWMSYYEANGSPNNRSAMWYTDLSGNKQKLTGEDHWAVWGGDWRGTGNATGTKVLYGRTHEYGDPYKVYSVDVGTGAESLVTWTSNLNSVSTFMTRSGRYVFASGYSGDYGYHYNTLFDLYKGTSRDSWSYYLPFCEVASNITADDRYYFVLSKGYGTNYLQRFYRVDKNPGASDFDQAPNITAIHFSAPNVLHDADPEDVVAVTVSVTDAQGLDNLDWVRLAVLVDGAESPPFYMGRVPLTFSWADSGSVLLSDDGENDGDETAGDGIYTFDEIATRKGYYEGMNTWYDHYTLPHDVGIRIIAKDKDDNYTIADTTLTIGPYIEPRSCLMPVIMLLLD